MARKVKAKVTQAEVAEVRAVEREIEPEVVPEVVEAVPEGRARLRDETKHRRQFAAPDEDAAREAFQTQYAGWASGHPGAQPPPPVPGRTGLVEAQAQPTMLYEAQILAMVLGGGYYYDQVTRKREHVGLLDGKENSRLKERCATWFDEPLYDSWDSSEAPWGHPRNDYYAARNEAVRRWQERAIAHRTKNVLTSSVSSDGRLRCEGCKLLVAQLAWSEKHQRSLCRDCGPDLVFLAKLVGS